MRLRHPEAGTVVEVGDRLAETYMAAGWVSVDRVQAAPRRKPRKTDSTEGE